MQRCLCGTINTVRLKLSSETMKGRKLGSGMLEGELRSILQLPVT